MGPLVWITSQPASQRRFAAYPLACHLPQLDTHTPKPALSDIHRLWLPQGLDDVQAGLNRVGAHVALGFRQAANTLGHYIPSDLNPFAEDDVYEEGDDEKERRRR